MSASFCGCAQLLGRLQIGAQTGDLRAHDVFFIAHYRFLRFGFEKKSPAVRGAFACGPHPPRGPVQTEPRVIVLYGVKRRFITGCQNKLCAARDGIRAQACGKEQAVALGKRHSPAAANDCAAAGQAQQGMEALAVRAQRRAARLRSSRRAVK